MNLKINKDNVRILGRTKVINDITYIDYTCSGIEFEFTGTSISAAVCTDSTKWEENLKAWVAVFINDEPSPSQRIMLSNEEEIIKLYESDTVKTVKIRLMKMSEAAFSKVGIKYLTIEGEGKINPTKSKAHKIEFIGDSITCGYGNEGVWNVDTFNTTQENPWEAYAAKTARYFDADFNCISWSGIGIISSWTDTDEANTAWLMPMLYNYTDAALDNDNGKKEFEVWDNNRFKPDLIVINLGTNDASYAKDKEDRREEFRKGYYDLLKLVRGKNPDSQIICTLGAMGRDLCPSISKAVDDFKASVGDTKLNTFFFEVQEESDGIGSDWHPSLKTHEKMANGLIEKVKEIMKW